MAGLWYRAGTVAVTNGSKKVVGTGTTWKSGTSKPDKGHTVWAPDGKAYELDYVESDTVLYLVTAYSGVTVSGAAYAIDISRSGTNSAFSRDLSAFVAYHQLQMDGWQQLLTGTGDVTLTAPDGTTLTVPSWEKIMNAGTGVVAQAKTEADRAKTEAQAAAASAAAAGNAVVAAALPLPDVWAPLSDSLRLITGYGRDVLVGSDVVARMVNFSRSTTATYIGKDGQMKTAAANEPRFEKEGLLIEGQSTNYIPKSEYYSDYVKSNLTVSGKVLTRSVTTGESYLNIGSYNLPTGKVTISAAYKKSSAVNFDYFNVYCERFTPKAANLVKVKELDDIIIVSATVDADFSVGAAGVFFKTLMVGNGAGSIQLEYFQMEALPFASSYIPTNGAAATRSADVLTFPGAGNQPPIKTGAAFTIAMQLSAEESPVGYRDILSSSGASFNMIRRIGSALRYYRDGSGQNSVSAIGKKLQVSAIRVTAENQCSWRVGSAIKTTTETPAVPGDVTAVTVSNLYGHIRNIRIWHIALNDDQFKAIA
ncbi:phage head spike fiber domain-containing protein [Aeromonas veronii]|uniref:phage head spike fiber domain-containing protein n=1 Tax=Aeromonas veronii TaxID=654 RepID=UPI003D250C59